MKRPYVEETPELEQEQELDIELPDAPSIDATASPHEGLNQTQEAQEIQDTQEMEAIVMDQGENEIPIRLNKYGRARRVRRVVRTSL